MNAANRAVGNAPLGMGIDSPGFGDGFQGQVDNLTAPLDKHALAGMLTIGGTVPGTGLATGCSE